MSKPETKRQEPKRIGAQEQQQQHAGGMEVAGATPELISQAMKTAPDDVAGEHHVVARVAYIATERDIRPVEVWKRLDEFSHERDQRENRDPPTDHLSAGQPGAGWGNDQSASKVNEWWCQDCRARITVSHVDEETEYGHSRDCEHCITDDLRFEVGE